MLRRYEASDVPAFRSAVAETPDVPWFQGEDAGELVARMGSLFDRGEQLHYGLFSTTGLLMGGACLEPAGRNRGRIGYWLVPTWRGRGLATAAVAALIRVGVDGLGLARIELVIGEDNLASQAVARRLGFQCVEKTVYALDALTMPSGDDPGNDWEDLVRCARNRFAVVAEGADELQLSWTIATRDGASRQSGVTARRLERYGRTWIEITSPVAPEAAWVCRAALVRGDTLAAGGLVLRDGWLVARAVLPGGAGFGAFARSLEIVAYEAAALALAEGQVGRAAPVFENLYQ